MSKVFLVLVMFMGLPGLAHAQLSMPSSDGSSSSTSQGREFDINVAMRELQKIAVSSKTTEQKKADAEAYLKQFFSLEVAQKLAVMVSTAPKQ